MPKVAIVLYGIVLLAAAVAAQSSSAEDASTPTPSLPSLARASAYFDSAQLELDRFMESICRANQSYTALTPYIQKLSRFRVELVALRIGKQERGFVTTIVGQLKLQKSQLKSMAQIVQPEVSFDLKEAESQLNGAVQLTEEKLDRSPNIRWQFGWKPTEPEKLLYQRRWETTR